jgi:tRNA-uridine 2-sulfurtransferase
MLKRNKKVLVGMSGGVDSSVAACLLLEQGYEVVGVHMKYWADEDESDSAPANRCCTVESAVKAIYVCRKLKIPLMIFDFRKEFKKMIVDHYLSATAKGLTPNPCVECNRTVKFGLFLEKMKELGADFIATGHYARVRQTGLGKRTQFRLLEAVDKDKDQSYFLYTLTQEKLRHILFPLGDLLKSETRKLAVKFGLEEINEQKESQNLCFLPSGSRDGFLKRHLGEKKLRPGPIVDGEGKVLGRHSGLAMYTIGQRKGICVGGGPPLYVVGADYEKNTLLVGGEEELYRKTAALNDVTFVAGKKDTNGIGIFAKIRYRHKAVPAILKVKTGKKGDAADLVFDDPQRAVTPGQSVVFYRGEEVLGGGVIT